MILLRVKCQAVERCREMAKVFLVLPKSLTKMAEDSLVHQQEQIAMKNNK